MEKVHENTPSSWMVDEATKKVLNRIPLLKTRAGPRDGEQWVQRLREELHALIDYMKVNKQNDADWVEIQSNPEGTKWHGQCWYLYAHERYQFDFEFEIPAAYPDALPEIAIPVLDGRTAKMYRGGFICLSDHFKPLWSRNSPKFGIAHALALGLGPWLAVEVPDLLSRGLIEPKRIESDANGAELNAATAHS